MGPEPLFLPAAGGERLFAVWRAPAQPRGVWVVCPPFAEEDKSSRRTLTEVCEALNQHGDATLLFSYRGTGDSSGDFANCTLEGWREDLRTAVAEARRRAPGLPLGLLGVRLGAALAYLEASGLEPRRLVLLEPLMSGRSYLAQQAARKKLRSQMTQAQGAAAEGAPANAQASVADGPPLPDGVEDLDGWPLGAGLRAGLGGLDLRSAPGLKGIWFRALQVGPRPEVAPPLQTFVDGNGGSAAAVVMPAFWNLLDYTPAGPLTEALVGQLGTSW